MHQNSLMLFEKYAKHLFSPGTSVLEIGPSGFPSPYRTCLEHDNIVWDTLDIHDNPQLTYPNSSEYRFPIESGYYDIILSAQVIEHVPKIWVWIKEIARVCKKNGHVVTINPVSWPYHEAPVDCWRIYPEGMKALYEEAGLNALHSCVESVEGQGIRRTIPGIGIDCQHPKIKFLNYFYRLLGLPAECAYDTITIGQK